MNSLSHTHRIDFRSGLNRRGYSLSIARPIAADGQDPVRILYVLDGDFYFASAVQAVRVDPRTAAAFVVGVGYSAEENPARARLSDLTLPASDAVLTAQHVPGLFEPKSTDVGGLDDFLRIIELEIKPRILDVASTSKADQAIFGHSLGGLAVLHALFTAPDRFQSYIAASPSIGWSDNAVLEGEEAFTRAVNSGTATPRVLITVGANENEAPPNLAATLGVDPEALARSVRQARMVDNAHELAARLQRLSGTPPFRVEDAVFPGQGHLTSAWPALGRTVEFAWARTENADD